MHKAMSVLRKTHCNYTLLRHFHNQIPRKPHKSPIRKPTPFITDLKDIQNPDEALAIYHDYIETGGFKHDYPSYSSLIYKLARKRNFEAVETLLQQLHHYNVRCKEALFIGLIQHYGKSGFPDKAIELFRRMPLFDCYRSLQSFNAILNTLLENGRFDDADEMFKSCSKMGFRPNAVSFNIMIKGWLGKGDWDEARPCPFIHMNIKPFSVFSVYLVCRSEGASN
ncbi:hypothetical protein L1987_77575 [Smallanthus sonchifolius]|uniref:Uncharacterized protein n=1 Tax=Smallanthus sonchifolius TaxID=185202 RepID=A0ACB8Z9Z9_9ASTR|nr:hypothetical protein L1987_77575 [Smallanthus sonchifolius]